MPAETKEVRAHARIIAERLGLVPWHEHRDGVLPHVYRQLGLGEYTNKKKRKRVDPVESCSVCYEDGTNVILAPCGHKCICAPCCAKVMAASGCCPMCRRAIQANVERVFQ
jgi:hypothetical protein